MENEIKHETGKPGKSLEGSWPENDIRRGFVAGASWWVFHKEGATIWQSDRDIAEVEAEKRYQDLLSQKPKTNHYVLLIHGDIEPEVIGPFDSEEARDQAAKALRSGDSDMDNGIFSLDCTGKPKVKAYSGGFLSGDFDDN